MHSGCERNRLKLNLEKHVLLMAKSSVMKHKVQQARDIPLRFHYTGTEEAALLARDAYRSNRGLLASKEMFNVVSSSVSWGRSAAGTVSKISPQVEGSVHENKW